MTRLHALSARRPVAIMRLLVAVAVVAPSLVGAPAVANAAGFSGRYAAYHTYPEMVREIKAVAAAHPDIVALSSIGKSYQGRTIWVAKISDNVAVDEAEPEVLFDGLHHAREHLSLEMTLTIFHWLVDGYGRDPAATRLVNSRETWIIFAVNPDGAQYDLGATPTSAFRGWRKNRQPTVGSRSIGTDLNRNYGYHFGCCGGSSGNPASIEYRGPAAFSAPETRAVRDFVNSRVVNGRQQIRVAITFHTQGQQVLWPYGYTKKDVPSDMTLEDWRVLSTLGRQMAATNGYRAMQSSDLYITDGDEIDWLYGVHRIFVYTFELYPNNNVAGIARFYPPGSIIARETKRNLPAVRRLMDVAGCPYAVVGLAVTNCGAFFDDFEIDRGWKMNPDGTDTATSGAWQRGVPQATFENGPKQLGTATSGARVLVTGKAAGATADAYDLDGGTTTVQSPPIRLSAAAGQRLTFRWSFAHDAAATADDYLKVSVIGVTATADALLVVGTASNRNGAWMSGSFLLDAFAGQTIRIRIEAAGGGADNLVEAMFDDVRVTRPS